MSREQAEPPPERNHPPPSDFMLSLPQDLQGELMHLTTIAREASQFSQTLGARGYGQRTGRRQTGHLMFFPAEPPPDTRIALGPDGGRITIIIPSHEAGTPDNGIDPVLASSGLSQEQARTLMALNVVPQEALHALLNVPDVPLGEWRRLNGRRLGVARERGRSRDARRESDR